MIKEALSEAIVLAVNIKMAAEEKKEKLQAEAPLKAPMPKKKEPSREAPKSVDEWKSHNSSLINRLLGRQMSYEDFTEKQFSNADKSLKDEAFQQARNVPPGEWLEDPSLVQFINGKPRPSVRDAYPPKEDARARYLAKHVPTSETRPVAKPSNKFMQMLGLDDDGYGSYKKKIMDEAQQHARVRYNRSLWGRTRHKPRMISPAERNPIEDIKGDALTYLLTRGSNLWYPMEYEYGAKNYEQP